MGKRSRAALWYLEGILTGAFLVLAVQLFTRPCRDTENYK